MQSYRLLPRLEIEPVSYPQIPTALGSMLELIRVQVIDMNRYAARLASQAFRTHRKADCEKTGVSPEFFIGAHTLTESHTLLTRDGARYRSYFPGLALICP